MEGVFGREEWVSPRAPSSEDLWLAGPRVEEGAEALQI